MNNKLHQFREQLYQQLYLYNRADVIFDTIDALCCAQGVQSLAELTLLPAFRGRQYSGLYQAIAHFPLRRQDILPLLLKFEPQPRRRPLRRFNQEHKHRFLSQHLLATDYETPVTDHEERWWRIVSLAQARWRPWEKHLAKKQAPSPVRILSLTHVQRDFQRILGQIGTPARRLKPRENPGDGRQGSVSNDDHATKSFAKAARRPLSTRFGSVVKVQLIIPGSSIVLGGGSLCPKSNALYNYPPKSTSHYFSIPTSP